MYDEQQTCGNCAHDDDWDEGTCYRCTLEVSQFVYRDSYPSCEDEEDNE